VVNKKIEIVRKALANYEASQDSPLQSKDAANILRWFGGAEIACIVGSILQASEMNLPVLIDGFIVSTAALVAAHLSPKAVRVYFLADSVPTEKGHQVAISEIAKIAKSNDLPPIPPPALAMGLRLGEGTGGLLAVPILQSACELSGMATLESILGKTS
jgi:nicotinate-nucleotide--dimethylbenzimidazole phosphoribosyltransferase